ncbi:MAG: hypothetical protein ABEK03_10095 [Candidatus Bipolaricaulia bacterium]
MASITLPQDLEEILEYVEGDTSRSKVLNLIQSDLKMRLRECDDEIYRYEVKYGMSFSQFTAAWEAGTVDDRGSHPLERDYMVWEGLEAEKSRYLTLIARVNRLD